MPLEDKAVRRRVEHEISKFSLDFTLTNVAVINQVCYFTGRVRPLRGAQGAGVDLRREMAKVCDAVMLLPGIKECALNIQYDEVA
jgi:hypothetical protein